VLQREQAEVGEVRDVDAALRADAENPAHLLNDAPFPGLGEVG
jgi:hypothetical protein